MRSKGWSIRLKPLAGAWKPNLGPRRHAIAVSIQLKVILHLMKLRVLLYGWSYFSEMRTASLLKAIMADKSQPPLVDRTRGVKVATMLHFEDTLFVSSLLLMYIMSSVASIGEGCTIRWCVGVKDSDIKELRLIVCFCSRNFGPRCRVLCLSQYLYF